MASDKVLLDDFCHVSSCAEVTVCECLTVTYINTAYGGKCNARIFSVDVFLLFYFCDEGSARVYFL
jgi:hypothetical protein